MGLKVAQGGVGILHQQTVGGGEHLAEPLVIAARQEQRQDQYRQYVPHSAFKGTAFSSFLQTFFKIGHKKALLLSLSSTKVHNYMQKLHLPPHFFLSPHFFSFPFYINNVGIQKKVVPLQTVMNKDFIRDEIYGDRLLMMHQGRAIVDKEGEDKKKMGPEKIMHIFNEISIECGN